MLSARRTNELLDLEVELDPQEILSVGREEEKEVDRIARSILAIIRSAKGTRASIRRFYNEHFLELPEIESQFPKDGPEDDAAWLARQDAPALISGGFEMYAIECFLESIREKYPSIYEKCTSDRGYEKLFEYLGDIVRLELRK